MDSTDLERHVNQPGRADLVKKVREKINELNVDYIYYQFISVTGRIVGKGGTQRTTGNKLLNAVFSLFTDQPQTCLLTVTETISATAPKRWSLSVSRTLKHSVSYLGISA